MGSNPLPRDRGENVGVTLDLAVFTRRFFASLRSAVDFTGPGPCSSRWHSYLTSESERFAIDYLAEQMYTKFDDGVKSSAKRDKAISRFWEGETLCALTNFKFSPDRIGQCAEWLDPKSDLAPDLREVVLLARKHISRVLGKFPGWDMILDGMNFGPGATTRLARQSSHRSNKWAGRPHVTITSASPLTAIFGRYPLLWSRLEGSGAEICPGNKLEWVPKNYKTDRTIAIEPDWNMYIQKGLGSFIRRRLKRVKQDLDDQSTNQFLAALGSITDDLATLDLSMASDTVSYRLVETLIRPDWFEALEQCRSQIGFYGLDDELENFDGSYTRYKQTAVVYEKFSSMGNGFTFELESLIFWGLLRAVSELAGASDHRLYVYGDDLIVPREIAGNAIYYLRLCGFMVNTDKSFVSGPFRESCGVHYFKGVDVTPFYIREPVDSLDRLFLLHNNVYRWFNRHPGICDPENVRSLLGWIRSFAPADWRKPRLTREDVGDGAFIGSFDEVTPEPAGRAKRRRGWEGWKAITLQYRPLRSSPVKTYIAQDGRITTVKTVRAKYPRGSGPDLASLHDLEKRREAYVPWVVQPKSDPIFWARFTASECVSNSTPQVVPLSERYWYTGVQVLPWISGSSWWNRSPLPDQ